MSSKHSFVLIPSASCSAQVIYFEWEKNTFRNLHFCLLEEVLKRRCVLKKDIHFIVRTTISVRVKAPARLQKTENQQRTLHILALNTDHHSIHSTQVRWEQYNSFFHSLWAPRQQLQLHSDVLYLHLQYLFPVKFQRVSVFAILYIEHILNEWIHFHFLCFNSGWVLIESVVEGSSQKPFDYRHGTHLPAMHHGLCCATNCTFHDFLFLFGLWQRPSEFGMTLSTVTLGFSLGRLADLFSYCVFVDLLPPLLDGPFLMIQCSNYFDGTQLKGCQFQWRSL